MPAKPLSADQRADAARLKAAFKQWQADRRASNLPASQDEVADELFGFGQSALSQYLNGIIPLNPEALQKFCKVLAVMPSAISPGIVAAAQERAAAWMGLVTATGATPTQLPRSAASNVKKLPAPADTPPINSGLRKTRLQKDRNKPPPKSTRKDQ